jgi:glycosyltransferase involved in cell wall biosynthesis
MIAEKANLLEHEKQYDFVYFANYISKSLDLVVEAFGIAYNRNSSLTLDIIGGGNSLQIEELNKRLDALCCKDAVTIEGKLPTHNDVISQIRKARFALLPLKIDVVSSTIREAMWNGLPVVTTITSGTPSLNRVRESVLLSPIGDHEALASNMLRLVNEPDLAKRLRNNAAITVDEMFGNNSQRAHEWEEAYQACIENFNNGTPLPENMINKN